MKKFLFGLFLLLQIQGLYAWFGHAIIVSHDKPRKGWNVLLYSRIINMKQSWHDFAKKAQLGQKGAQVAEQAFKDYKLDTFFNKKILQTPWLKIDNDIFHIVDVTSQFTSGSELYKKLIKNKKMEGSNEDIAWFQLNDVIAGTIKHKKGGVVTQSTKNALKQVKLKLSNPSSGSKTGTFKLVPVGNITIDCGSFDPLSKQIKHQWPSSSVSGKSILFYSKNKAYYEFTNTALYTVKIKNYDKETGKVHQWKTTEHYYQSQKDPNNPQALYKEIENTVPGQLQAKLKTIKKRTDWNTINKSVMLEAIRAKFSQHQKLKTLLLSTGSAILVEDAGKNDAFYGAGPNYTGCNHLGQMLMHVRKELRDQKQYKYIPQTPKYWYDQISGSKTYEKNKKKTASSPNQELVDLSQSLKKIANKP